MTARPPSTGPASESAALPATSITAHSQPHETGSVPNGGPVDPPANGVDEHPLNGAAVDPPANGVDEHPLHGAAVDPLANGVDDDPHHGSGMISSVATVPRRCRCFRPGPPTHRVQLGRPEDAAGLLTPRLAGADREHCLLVSLDTKHRLVEISTVSVGTADHTFMSPREIFRDALLSGASAIVVAHNHPSGDPTPSADDRQVTRRLAQAGATTGIELLDHLVIGDPDWVSLARLGVL